MRIIVVVFAALIAGFAGGLLGALSFRDLADGRTNRIVTARAFELVNQDGERISFWGVNEGGQAMIAFGSRGIRERAAGHSSSHLPEIANPENQLAAFGLESDDGPMLKMSGIDRKTRVRLLVNPDGKPTLLMEDERGPRLLLGIEQSDTPGPQDNDWVLTFLPAVARIGMLPFKDGGKTYVQGALSIRKDRVPYP